MLLSKYYFLNYALNFPDSLDAPYQLYEAQPSYALSLI